MFSVFSMIVVGAAFVIPVVVGMKVDANKRKNQCVVYVGTEGVN